MFLREEIQSNLVELLLQGGEFCLQDEKTYDLFATFLTRVVGNQELKEGVMENMLYSPVKSFLAMGYNDSDEVQAQEKTLFEQELDEQFEDFDDDEMWDSDEFEEL